MEDYKTLYEESLIKLEELQKKISELSEHLSKYTSPARNKEYYKRHREELLEKAKEYNKTKVYDAEKKKQYNKEYYRKIQEQKKLNEATTV
jgi:hypothetical protein